MLATIVIAARNAAGTIERAVRSAVDQNDCVIMLVDESGAKLEPMASDRMSDVLVRSLRGIPVAVDGASCGTAAYRLVKSRLRRVWQNSHAGTSPVVAGGLLYVYDPAGGELRIYRPTTGSAVASLPAGAGHWNSPIVVAGMVALPEGDANEHRQSGVLDIYRLP